MTAMRIDIKAGGNAEDRTFIITLTAPAKAFVLADVLSQRGVMTDLATQLKQAVREATESYLSGAENFIASVAAERKKEQPVVSPALPKSQPKRKTKTGSPPFTNGEITEGVIPMVSDSRD